jgi:hypothetical protein
MQIIERAEIIGRSFGESRIVIVYNQFTNEECSFVNPNGFELEIGQVGFLTVNGNEIVSFEVMETIEIMSEVSLEMAN